VRLITPTRRRSALAAVTFLALLTSCAVPDLSLFSVTGGASATLRPVKEQGSRRASRAAAEGARSDAQNSPSSESETSVRSQRAVSSAQESSGQGVAAIGARTSRPRLRVWKRPDLGARRPSVTARNPLGKRLVFLIDAERRVKGRRWLRIFLADRPNESTAWVPKRAVQLVPLQDRIKIDLSSRTLELYKSDKLVDRFSVGIGQDQWPTPTGTYFVWARVPQPRSTGPYGVFALGLSAFSPVLTDWPGGGRVAIHGTADASDRGVAVSHGCVRVFNRDMEKLKVVPLGTPVTITR
jgi:lipoprotein-anchoring transpeptidase ErfK/SrfK